jgi:hypothetical protein
MAISAVLCFPLLRRDRCRGQKSRSLLRVKGCFESKESAKSLARANAHGRDSSDCKQNDVVNEI